MFQLNYPLVYIISNQLLSKLLEHVQEHYLSIPFNDVSMIKAAGVAEALSDGDVFTEALYRSQDYQLNSFISGRLVQVHLLARYVLFKSHT